MEFVISEKAKTVIEKKGSVFTISRVACGWAGAFQRLWSEASNKSESDQDYDKYEYDGITIYIDKRLAVSKKVEIELKSNLPLFGPTFTIKGISL